MFSSHRNCYISLLYNLLQIYILLHFIIFMIMAIGIETRLFNWGLFPIMAQDERKLTLTAEGTDRGCRPINN